MPELPLGLAGVAPISASPQFVDPAVSRAKFERAVQQYRAMESEYLRRGWILVRAEFPEVVVIFAAPQLVPSPVALAVAIDFTNYDFWPLSVRFVHPFTLKPLTAAEMPMQLVQIAVGPDGQIQPQPLIMSQADQVPFLCVRGVREYHAHPAHSNDPWLAHRTTGVGTIYDLLNIIWECGPRLMRGWSVRIQLGVPVSPAAANAAADAAADVAANAAANGAPGTLVTETT